MSAGDRLVVGQVRGHHGLRGAVRVESLTDREEERFAVGRKLYVEGTAKPLTIAEVSRKLFGTVKGYNILLALEETGAHVEYLYQRGMLRIENLAELEQGVELKPILYQCVECKVV